MMHDHITGNETPTGFLLALLPRIFTTAAQPTGHIIAH